MGLLGGKKCDAAVQVFFKLFLDTQVGGGSIRLALKAIPNKEQHSGSKWPQPRGRGQDSLHLCEFWWVSYNSLTALCITPCFFVPSEWHGCRELLETIRSTLSVVAY